MPKSHYDYNVYTPALITELRALCAKVPRADGVKRLMKRLDISERNARRQYVKYVEGDVPPEFIKALDDVKHKRFVPLDKVLSGAPPAGRAIRRLYLDIETSPNIGMFWRAGFKLTITPESIIKERAIIMAAYKWEGDKQPTVLTWDKDQDDKALLKELSVIIGQADEVVGHNCVTQDTRLLTRDLRYVPAGDIKVGDKLVGFDEEIAGRGRRRQFKESVVTHSQPIDKPCLKLNLSDGTSIKCSVEHPFLVPNSHGNGANWHWSEARHLKVGEVLTRVLPTFEHKKTYDTGYLAGFYDGEGCVTGFRRAGRERSASGHIGTLKVSCSQKGGKTMQQVLGYLDRMGYTYSSIYENGTPERYDMVYHWSINGKSQSVKFLGEVRPERLIRNLKVDLIGGLHVPKEGRTTIVSIEDIGTQTVQEISTSTKTYIAEGLPSHNCDRFDLPWVRTRCLFHGLEPLPDVRVIDTLKWARSKFYFNSNKLDYIAKYLGIGGKLKTEFGLWKEIVLNRCPKALARMSDYCANDVLLLERVWARLYDLIAPKTHVGVLAGGDKWTDPRTGSTDVSLSKTRVTAAGVVQYQMRSKAGSYYSISQTAYDAYREAKGRA